VTGNMRWDECAARLLAMPLWRLEAYWVDSQLRGREPLSQGPEWAPQRQRARSMASLGRQRATGSARRGLPALLPAGLGCREHVDQCLQLPHPFSQRAPVDDDMAFACRMTAILGPYVVIWRRRQIKAIKALLSQFLS